MSNHNFEICMGLIMLLVVGFVMGFSSALVLETHGVVKVKTQRCGS